MNSYMNFWDKIFNFFGGILDSFYQSVIYDNRYVPILIQIVKQPMNLFLKVY